MASLHSQTGAGAGSMSRPKCDDVDREERPCSDDRAGRAIAYARAEVRSGCRILVIGPELSLSRALAAALPDCTIVLLSTAIRERSRAEHHPSNLEILSCHIEAAGFLARSIACVFASADELEKDSRSFSTVALWVDIGGALVLATHDCTRFRWRRRLREFLGLHSTVPPGLVRERKPERGWEMFRRVQ